MKQHIFGNFLHIWFKHENLTSPNTPSTPITSWDLCAAVLKMTEPKTMQAAPREPMSNKYSHNYWARPPVSWDHHGKNRRNLSHIFNIIKYRQYADFRELYQDIKPAVNCIKQKGTLMGLISGQELQLPLSISLHKPRTELAEATSKIFQFHPPSLCTNNFVRAIIWLHELGLKTSKKSH